MSSGEYQDLKRQMDRIERLLARLVGEVSEPVAVPEAFASVAPGASEQERTRALQQEGHYILATQGFSAYKRFWQDQHKKCKTGRRKAA